MHEVASLRNAIMLQSDARALHENTEDFRGYAPPVKRRPSLPMGLLRFII